MLFERETENQRNGKIILEMRYYMNKNDIRIGNYLNVILQQDPEKKSRCRILDISDDKEIATFIDLSNNSSFKIDTPDKWNLVEGILMSDAELSILGFVEEPDKQVFMLLQKGAWVKDGIQVQKYKGDYELLISKPEAFFGCRSKTVPYVHLLQNALSDIYDINIL